MVSEIGGLQAQLMSSAEMGLWARVEGVEADTVQTALWDERSLVKTWAMRGTLHLLPSSEFPLWQAGFSTYPGYLRPIWLRYFKVTRDQMLEMIESVGRALDGRLLTRQELAREVGKLSGSAGLEEMLLSGWGTYLKPAAHQGRLCFAPSSGQNVRFTHPRSWLRQWADVDPPLALMEVTRRYLRTCGPSTREDLARWWGTDPPNAGRMLASLGDEVVPVDVEGRRTWMLAADAGDAAQSSPAGSVRLLPAFDQYVVGATRQAPAILATAFRERVYRPQAWMSPVLLVDGRMEGVWRHERKGKRLVVRIEPFTKLSAPVRRAATEEAERLACFVGGKLDLSWAP